MFLIHSSVNEHLGCFHCKQCCCEHWGARVFLNWSFHWSHFEDSILTSRDKTLRPSTPSLHHKLMAEGVSWADSPSQGQSLFPLVPSSLALPLFTLKGNDPKFRPGIRFYIRTTNIFPAIYPNVLQYPDVLCQRIDAFELWCWRRLLRVPWTARRSNQSILKEISPEYSL